jgi:hypothetical protein
VRHKYKGVVVRHVLIGCTAGKLGQRAPAYKLYTGVTWQSWRKHIHDGWMPVGWRLWALSAEHGLLRFWDPVEPYDRKLNETRVSELVPRVCEQWAVRTSEIERWLEVPGLEHEAVIIGGALYQRLAVEAGIPVVARIDGRVDSGKGGIGVLRQRVENFASDVRSSGNATPEAEGAWSRAVERWPARAFQGSLL